MIEIFIRETLALSFSLLELGLVTSAKGGRRRIGNEEVGRSAQVYFTFKDERSVRPRRGRKFDRDLSHRGTSRVAEAL